MERRDGVDLGRAASGKVAGEEAHEGQEESDGEKALGIGRAHPIKKVGKKASSKKRRQDPEHDTPSRKAQAFPQDRRSRSSRKNVSLELALG